MANRRMFSKDIVRSDFFLDLPATAQLLYFHLGMEADDRGYISNAKSIMRTIGVNQGDLEILVQKKFLLIRNENLILVKGWKINNCIQPSRLIETKFTEDMKKLYLDSNNSYTERPTEIPCQQIVDKVSTQVSIGKVSIVENSIDKNSIKEKKERKIERTCVCTHEGIFSFLSKIREDISSNELFLRTYQYIKLEDKDKELCLDPNLISKMEKEEVIEYIVKEIENE